MPLTGAGAFARYSEVMNEPLQTYLASAVQAARAAGRIQQYHLESELEISTKSSDTDLVTKVDRLCEEAIREILLGHYPDHVVFGEEQGQLGEARHRWIVDPLDGTLNYAHGFPFYCVSIALELDGLVQLGVVFDSAHNELFSAIRGQGALRNGVTIQVSQETQLKKALLATGFSYHEKELMENLEVFARVHPKVRAIRRPGAAALDLSYVACGRLDGFWELKLNPWDVAAGMLIIQEAGGTVTGPAAEPYSFGNKVVVASNGRIHAKLLNALGLGDALA
jgi:myo-inositol-1(or 4)-monophosphatase